MHAFTSELSVLFHWSIFLFLCQYHTVLMIVASDCTEVRQVEKKMKEAIAKINKTKSWFFEKINKTDKLLTHQEKKGEDPNQQNRK